MTKHGKAPGQGEEFTMCGLSFDAHASGDHDEPVVFAKVGQYVTCDECKHHIIEVLERFTSTGRVKS